MERMSTTTGTFPLLGSARSRLHADPAVRRRILLFACLAAVYVIWGSTYYAMHVGLESFPPFTMAGLRFLIAGGGLMIALRLRGAALPNLRQWGASALTGTLLLGVGNGAVAYAQQWLSSSLAAIVVCTMPIWVAILGALFGQKPSRL